MSVTVTDYFTHVEFIYSGQAIPATIDLDDLLPGGALDRTHLEMRTRAFPGLWAAWDTVPAWDQATRVATVIDHPVGHSRLQVRRRTPRNLLFATPVRPEQRVDEENLRVCANQGFMMAYEWAAELGLNPRASLLAPNYTLTQQMQTLTQMHLGSDHDYTQTLYNFQFAGGYMSRSHVKVQVKNASGWQELSIDSSSWLDFENGSPYRFNGPNTLYLDLSALAPVSGLIIHRHTPRDVAVEYMLDGTGITAVGMEPSATHALFVAMELGEQLSQIVPCECMLTYTSTIYPIFVEENMQAGNAVLTDVLRLSIGMDDMQVPTPTMISALLTTVIGVFISYTNGRDFGPDTMTVPTPALVSGALTVIISFLSYTNGRDFGPDSMAVPTPTLLAGALTVVINYVSYTNGRDFGADTMTVPTPSLIAGVLA